MVFVTAVAVIVVADFGLLLELLNGLSLGLALSDGVLHRTSVSVCRRNVDTELIKNRFRFRVDKSLASQHLLDAIAVRRREMLLDQTLLTKRGNESALFNYRIFSRIGREILDKL